MSNSSQHSVALKTAQEPRTTPEPVTPPPHPHPKFQTTPFIRKLSGNPTTKKSLKHIQMDPALKEELAGSQLVHVEGLIEHLFPDSLFPVQFEKLEDAVRRKHWSASLKNWNNYNPILFTSTTKTKTGTGETALATFLDEISKTLLNTCGKSKPPQPRSWISESQKSLTGGPDARRKPDVCLLEKGQDLTWSSVLAVVELKSRRAEAGKALVRLTNHAFMAFSTQDERRFFIGVSVCFTDICVYIFDRSGVIGSKPFDMRKNSNLLIRVIAGLVLGSVDLIGLDSSIRHGEDGTRYITIARLEYELTKTLFISDSIRGRSTVCWQARRNNTDYIIKNTWSDNLRIQTEADILRLAKDVDGIAHLVAAGMVRLNGKVDSTANIRACICEDYHLKALYDKLEVRLHRRLVTFPVADKLTSFKSKRELLTVLISAIEAHGRLVDKHILHRDISIANIMIYRPKVNSTSADQSVETVQTIEDCASEASPSPVDSSANLLSISSNQCSTLTPAQATLSQAATGILIDLDYALITHDAQGNKLKRQSDATGHRTGTLPFMATRILIGLKPGEEHEARHDLESFFYVLLWITLQYAGPDDAERQDLNIEDDEDINPWIEGKTVQRLGRAKFMAMATQHIFQDVVTSKCTKYFADLVPCLEELREIFFPYFNPKDPKPTPPPTHRDIIEILRKHMQPLPENDNWSRENDPIGYGSITRKRKVDNVEEEDEDDEEQSADYDSPPQPATPKRAKTAPSRMTGQPSRKSSRIQSMAPS
ncbi:hypothetical protein CVT25_002078 [Psilocybe cyanescens]|uniref:Fungal-type protein kinase domain-containing protein n=1 Tax=Psilocybe cyanescens TaxID=93625 RepID=A0A409X956_PSICY|nr:hypothetical protein CVT25_002078 [Psilocybe cyanescens]